MRHVSILCLNSISWNWLMPSTTATLRRWFTGTSNQKTCCWGAMESWRLQILAGLFIHLPPGMKCLWGACRLKHGALREIIFHSSLYFWCALICLNVVQEVHTLWNAGLPASRDDWGKNPWWKGGPVESRGPLLRIPCWETSFWSKNSWGDLPQDIKGKLYTIIFYHICTLVYITLSLLSRWSIPTLQTQTSVMEPKIWFPGCWSTTPCTDCLSREF